MGSLQSPWTNSDGGKLITPNNLLALAKNAGSCGGAPFIILCAGRDSRSWGLTVLGGERHSGRGEQPVQQLVGARWTRDLLELPELTLLAQSALRKLSLDRGWPIP